MDSDIDTRWKQRYSNYLDALSQLRSFIDKTDLNSMEEQGLIKSFEYTYELGWNVLKDYLEFQGETNIVGSRDAIRKAFNRELIYDGAGWMRMLDSRNKTSHTYNKVIADEVVEKIKTDHFILLEELNFKFSKLIKEA